MPVRNADIFEDITVRLREGVNPWVRYLVEEHGSGELPALYGPYLQGLKGNWKQAFARFSGGALAPGKLILEVGAHKGQVLVEMAAEFPDYGFIGLDITFKRVVSAARKARDAGLKNVISVLADARFISDLFGASELAGCLIFFPDPWLKKKGQRHNRLLNEAFIRSLQVALDKGGFCWFKTDARDYFTDVTGLLDAAGFAPSCRPEPLTEDSRESVFESRFRRKKIPVYSGQWVSGV